MLPNHFHKNNYRLPNTPLTEADCNQTSGSSTRTLDKTRNCGGIQFHGPLTPQHGLARVPMHFLSTCAGIVLPCEFCRSSCLVNCSNFCLFNTVTLNEECWFAACKFPCVCVSMLSTCSSTNQALRMMYPRCMQPLNWPTHIKHGTEQQCTRRVCTLRKSRSISLRSWSVHQ